MWDFESEDLIKFAVEPDPIDLFYLVPIFESDNEVEALFDSNAADTENLCYVDNPDSAHLHVIAGKVGRGRHEFASLKHRNRRYVISHQTVTAFDQSEHTLAFADAARSANQNPNA